MAKRKSKVSIDGPKPIFTVLLYPPIGSPRVVELPGIPMRVAAATGVKAFHSEDEAEAALATFLAENPEYRRWRDGMIQPA